MADEYYDNDEAETYEESKPKRNGLREQLEAVLAEKKALEAEVNALKGQARERTVSEVLTAKGVNPKVAKFIPPDVEGNEAVELWLTENADVFGFTVNDAELTPQSNISEEEVTENKRLQNLNQYASTPSKVQDIEARLANATSEAEIKEIWAEAAQYFL
jgi:hypothetical protein